jgi:hypothetical protein
MEDLFHGKLRLPVDGHGSGRGLLTDGIWLHSAIDSSARREEDCGGDSGIDGCIEDILESCKVEREVGLALLRHRCHGGLVSEVDQGIASQQSGAQSCRIA